MMINFFKRLFASKELAELERYRLACTEIRRWNASIQESCSTAEFIQNFGEGKTGLDCFGFRTHLNKIRTLRDNTSPDTAGLKISPPPKCYCEGCGE